MGATAHPKHALTKEQQRVLTWLGEAPYSQYGECKGKTLDALFAFGLAKIHTDGTNQEGFIAKGKAMDYNAVSLTPEGKAVLKELKGAG